MLARTHLVFSVLLFLLLFSYLDNRFIFLAFLIFGTLFVDIDSRNSKIGKNILLRPLQWIFSHRGMFHSILMAFVLSIIIFLFSSAAGLGFLVGYLSHLFLDCFTKAGVKLFWPLFSFKISFGIKTSGIIEEILFVLVLLLDLVLIWKVVFN